MKIFHKLSYLLILIGTQLTLSAQSPLTFNYQAVLRDDAGQVMVEETVAIEVDILQGSPEGEAVFSEIHETQSNAFGLIRLQIGSINSLEGIQWGGDAHFIRIGLNGQLMGIQELLSVPYALHASTSADAFSGNYEDLQNAPNLEHFIQLDEPQQGDMLFYSAGSWHALPIGTEGQILGVEGGHPQWTDLPGGGDNGHTVSDIDGNVYPVILIGEQEWMGKNLRTTSFADGTAIAGNLDNTQWQANTTGAWAVYPHEGIEGIDSEEEMLDAYGALYNWFAVDNPSGLCPEGWHVATDEDWTQLTDYLVDQHDWIEHGNAANVLKSCRQVDSPLGGDCATDQHPRWNAHTVHHGTDDFGFSALPGGNRMGGGSYVLMGWTGFWWTSTEFSAATVFYRDLDAAYGSVLRASTNRERGFSVRCVKSPV